MQRDASNNSIGAVLLQDFEDGEHPIVYLHRVLTSAEQNYSPTEKECLALLWAIKKLRPYLDGYKFKAITELEGSVGPTSQMGVRPTTVGPRYRPPEGSHAECPTPSPHYRGHGGGRNRGFRGLEPSETRSDSGMAT